MKVWSVSRFRTWLRYTNQKASLEHSKLGYYHGLFLKMHQLQATSTSRLLWNPRQNNHSSNMTVKALYSSANYLFWCKLWPNQFRRTHFRWTNDHWISKLYMVIYLPFYQNQASVWELTTGQVSERPYGFESASQSQTDFKVSVRNPAWATYLLRYDLRAIAENKWA